MQKKEKNKIINTDNIFTDLFTNLAKYKECDNGDIKLDYSTRDISKMLLGVDNALTIILQSLQTFGRMIAASPLLDAGDMMQAGYFLTLMGNLLEALFLLRDNFEFALTSSNFSSIKRVVSCI